MKLSIVMPTYNEEKTILQILDKVLAVNLPNIEKEIIIVDDGSKDSTVSLVKKFKEDKNLSYIRIFVQEKNGGKGTAVRRGFKEATGDLVLIQDADLEYDPEDYPLLLKPILEKRTKVVFGSRFLRKDHSARYNFYYMGNQFLSLLTRILYLRNITDMETCYKLFTKDVLDRLSLRATRFDIEPEITAKVIKKGYSIIEVPIRYYSRSFEEGKKITWRDGLKAIWFLIKYRFVN
ncbi:MAG: glycosyltransferase family 2 protein [Candidatus Woesearchaeota archaeon]|nr:glycosyltransferase family 2 protein [Candidatus Woesearchaeota archaeon]MDP7457750.1 glycosyltransferase family 2 protein [Candidatus Woesearchaeota archaeon]